MARYTMDYNVLSSTPPLYRRRIAVVLDYYASLVRLGGHDVVFVDFCRNVHFATALATYNRDHGTRFVHFTDFRVELNENDHHPTAECDAEIARGLAPVIRDLERQRGERR